VRFCGAEAAGRLREFLGGLRVHRRFRDPALNASKTRQLNKGVPVLRVRDLLFARKERKSRFLTPFEKRTGFGIDMFFGFPQLVRLCSPVTRRKGTHGERKMAGFALARS